MKHDLRMDGSNKFSWKARGKSFVFAGRGIIVFFRYEHNARLHLIAFVVVIFSGWFFHLSATECLAVVFSSGLVFITEMINTAVEKSLNLFSPGWNAEVKIIKDIAAGAVLVAAVVSLVTAAIIFIPKILQL